MTRFFRLFLLLFLLAASAWGQNPPANLPTAPTPPNSPLAGPAATAPAPSNATAGQTAPEPKENGAFAGMSLRELLQKGGLTLYILIGLSGIMVALALYIALATRRGAVVSDHFMKTADALIRRQDYLGLLTVCSRRNEAIAQITQKALDFASKNPTATFDEVREVTEAEGQRQASILTQRITYLADVGKIAPMVGLLGTVFGIIKQFNEISQERAVAVQLEFAGGVSEALLNTAAGLFIAIPSMVLYSMYRGRVTSLISELEAACTHIMALLAAQYKRTAAAAAQRAADPGGGRSGRRGEG